MDKQNYIISGIDAQVIRNGIQENKEKIVELLKEKEVIKRRRVLKDYHLLVIAAYSYIRYNLSYQRLSDFIAVMYHVTMSDTAWKKQLCKAAPIIMEAGQEYLLECAKKCTSTGKNEILNMENAYAIDTTNVAQAGGGKQVMCVHTQLSLNDHATVQMKITDHHTAENVNLLPIYAHRLYIADRAYGKANQLAFLMQKKAEFIIRMTPHQLTLYRDKACTERIDFLSLSQSTDNCISVPCFLKTKDHVYPLRVVGERLPEEKQAAAEARVRHKAKKNKVKLRNDTVVFSKWMFLVTTLDSSIPAPDILAAYRERWQIELFFKRSKTLFLIRKLRLSAEQYKTNFLQLWISVIFTLTALQLTCFSSCTCPISDFNIFALLKEFLP